MKLSDAYLEKVNSPMLELKRICEIAAAFDMPDAEKLYQIY